MFLSEDERPRLRVHGTVVPIDEAPVIGRSELEGLWQTIVLTPAFFPMWMRIGTWVICVFVCISTVTWSVGRGATRYSSYYCEDGGSAFAGESITKVVPTYTQSSARHTTYGAWKIQHCSIDATVLNE